MNSKKQLNNLFLLHKNLSLKKRENEKKFVLKRVYTNNLVKSI